MRTTASAPCRPWRPARISRTGDETEERLREQRRRDVAVLEREWRAQAVAVGEQDQRDLAIGELQDQARVGVLGHPELPDDRLVVIALHEPTEAEWGGSTPAPCGFQRVPAETAVTQCAVEAGEILDRRDHADRRIE